MCNCAATSHNTIDDDARIFCAFELGNNFFLSTEGKNSEKISLEPLIELGAIVDKLNIYKLNKVRRNEIIVSTWLDCIRRTPPIESSTSIQCQILYLFICECLIKQFLLFRQSHRTVFFLLLPERRMVEYHCNLFRAPE